MKTERNYEFRKRMLEIHKKNIRNYDVVAKENELVIQDGFTIFMSETAGDVILTAARDFVDYLFLSMNISAMLKQGTYTGQENAMVIALASDSGVDLGDAAAYRGYRIDTTELDIFIHGYDERGAAQAIYSLEDRMNVRKAPFLPIGTVCRKPMFSPQMVHSGYGLDQYPNEHLSAIAHEGRDAILVFVKDVNITPYGYLDFNELIYRANKYGLDVYAYSYLKSEKHPDDDDAEAYYENTYGKLFKMCPGLKGVSLVGESVEFPSKDENVARMGTGGHMVDGIPTGKPRPGWYPCMDYPRWLALIGRIIRKYNPDADIIFWSYNWGAESKEARWKLIQELPADITLMATFEGGESYPLSGAQEYISDYTIVWPGYGDHYFKAEAEMAAERGLRLYAMTNTGGLTWDIGVIPYEPFPYQWMKRYRAMKEAQEKWGLCGIMESHHYGFYPSFISKLSKMAFNNKCENMEELLLEIIEGEFGSEHVMEIDKALRLWSEAIEHCVPTWPDQYGAFRVGPSYPFNLCAASNIPSESYAMFGSRIVEPKYWARITGRGTVTSVLIHKEIESLFAMKGLMQEGLALLKMLPVQNNNLKRLINLGEFILCTVVTGIHSKEWYLLKCKLNYFDDREKLSKVIDDMEALLRDEMKNVEATIPLVQMDSRLGWEPSMEYMTDERQLQWKIRQLKYVLNTELQYARKDVEM